ISFAAVGDGFTAAVRVAPGFVDFAGLAAVFLLSCRLSCLPSCRPSCLPSCWTGFGASLASFGGLGVSRPVGFCAELFPVRIRIENRGARIIAKIKRAVFLLITFI